MTISPCTLFLSKVFCLFLNKPRYCFQSKNKSKYDVCCCSVAKPCLTLCNPTDCSTPGSPVPHHLWVCPNQCPLNWRCHPNVSSSIAPSRITAFSWWRGLYNSVKLWAMSCTVTQNGWVIVENSDKMWSSGRENGKPPQYTSYKNPMNCIKMKKKMLYNTHE